MQLLAAWKDSLSLLKPANFKPFFLVTLKSLKDTYKVWLKYWGWLVVGFFALYSYVVLCPIADSEQPVYRFRHKSPRSAERIMETIMNTSAMEIVYLLFIVIFITLFLSCRPSIMKKDFKYFFGYAIHGIFLFIFPLLLIHFWRVSPIKLLLLQLGFETASGFLLNFLYLSTQIIVASWFICLFILFYLDSEESIKNLFLSIVRAIEMFLYNVPFCLIFGLGLWMFYVIGYFSLLKIISGLAGYRAFYENSCVSRLIFENTILFFNVLFFLPLTVCFTTNFYIKKIHDQFNLYFETK